MTKAKRIVYAAIAALAAIAITFGAGFYQGYKYPRAVDPQEYIDTSFMPYQSGIDKYLQFLDGTKTSLRVAVYELSEPRIVDKVLELQSRGVKDIKFLLDKSQTVSRSGKYEQAQIQRLRDAGIEVTIGTSEQKHNIMHLKMTIRDGLWTEDGSWNYSKSANTQANNINIIKSPMRARLFLDEWQRMYAYMSTQDQTPLDKSTSRHTGSRRPRSINKFQPTSGAHVNFAKKTVAVIFNPKGGSANASAVAELETALAQQGIGLVTYVTTKARARRATLHALPQPVVMTSSSPVVATALFVRSPKA